MEANAVAYGKLVRSAPTVPEVREVVDAVRDATARRILDGLPGDPSPARRTAVRAWLWFMDGAIADWLEHRDLDRPELRDLLLATLLGAVDAAQARPS